MSIATIWPLFCIKDAKWSVLPPAPAQVSTTFMPGFTSKNSATNCDDASCTSNQPSLKASVTKTLARLVSFKAEG